MDSRQTDRPQSWQQKESMNTGLPDAPEVYYDESSLQPANHRSGYVSKTLVVGQQHRQSGWTKHRYLWLLSIIATVLVLLALGLGIGLHFRSSYTSMSTISQQLATVTVTSLAPTTSGSSSSTTTAPVTSGSTGIAADDCRTRGTNGYTTNNNPTTFAFDCGADYPNTEPTYLGNGTVDDLLPLIAYTFEDCMEICAVYNKQQSITTQCVAVSYAANLTSSIAKHSDNCWLKSARGRPYYGDAVQLSSSAYIDLG